MDEQVQECKDSSVLPLLDGTAGTLTAIPGAIAVVALVADAGKRTNSEFGNDDPIVAAGFVIGLAAIPLFAGAVHGWRAVSACRAARDELHERRRAEGRAREPMRERARASADAAVLAARAHDCATARQAHDAAVEIDADLAPLLDQDDAIVHCARSVPRPSCFTADDTLACWPSEADCRHAVALFGLANVTCAPAP